MATAVVMACLMFVAFQSQVSNQRIRRSTAELKRLLYVADVHLASEALADNNIVQARELLVRHIPSAGERDLRGFAWHVLWDRSHPAELVFHGHHGAVQSVDCSPDGHEVVSADDSGQLLVWNPTSGNVLRQFDRWPAEITCVRYAPDGDSIVLADGDGRLALIDRQSGSVLRSVAVHDGRTNKVAFSPDGTLVITGGEDGVICVTETTTLAECFRVSAHGFRVHDVAFFAEGTRAVSVGADDTIQTWRVNGRELVRDSKMIVEGRNGTRNIAVAPNEPWLICSSGNGWLRKIDLNDLSQLAAWKVAAERFYEIRVSANGHEVVATGKDRLSRVVDTTTGATKSTFAGHERRVFAACYSPNGKRVVTGSADGICRIFPTAGNEHYNAGAN